MIRVPGMDQDAFVLLEPGIDGIPGHHDMVCDLRMEFGFDVDILGREQIAG